MNKQTINRLLNSDPSGKNLSLGDLQREIGTLLAIGLVGLAPGASSVRQIDDHSRGVYDKAMTSTLSAMGYRARVMGAGIKPQPKLDKQPVA
jgi:hypothetical protein